jgi:DNA-binding MarR family transcriptional regulator
VIRGRIRPYADARLEARTLACIRRRPGVRADEIAEALGETVPDVSLALRRLKARRAVKRRGQTRATTYRVAA